MFTNMSRDTCEKLTSHVRRVTMQRDHPRNISTSPISPINSNRTMDAVYKSAYTEFTGQQEIAFTPRVISRAQMLNTQSRMPNPNIN